MENKQYLGMDRNVFFGLGYLFGILLIIILITDKELTLEDKQLAVAGIVGAFLASFTCGIYGILVILAAIKYFGGEMDYRLPGAFGIAESLVKE